MASEALPFHSFTFTLVEDKVPRTQFRMSATDDGLFELHVERGSATNPSSQFTRLVPLEVAQSLKDALQAAGVFGWEESYDQDPSLPASRWSMITIFKEGVFSVQSKGGNPRPAGFDTMLEELYKLDFPRPATPKAGRAQQQLDVNAILGEAGLQGLDPSELSNMMAEIQRNPYALQQQMKDEFQHMSPEEQERMLDTLTSMGLASRAWWERFLRGL